MDNIISSDLRVVFALIFLAVFVLAFIPLYIVEAKDKGINRKIWYCYGFFLFPVALIHAIFKREPGTFLPIVNEPAEVNNQGLNLKRKLAFKTSAVIIALLTVVLVIGSIYYTTAIHIQKYTEQGDGDKLSDIVVNSSSYHFLGNSREIQLLALQSLHQVDLTHFREAGWKITRGATKQELNYNDVLAYSDSEDIKYFAHLYMGVPDAITAEGCSRYQPFSVMVDRLKKAAPDSSELKQITDIYRQKNIEKVQKDILKLLADAKNIAAYRNCQSQLAGYAIPIDNNCNKLLAKYEDNLVKLETQKAALKNLKNEKSSIKDPQKYDNEIQNLQNALAVQAEKYYYLSGYVVAQLSYSEYEIIVSKGGYAKDRGEVGRRAILETNDTRFEHKTPFRNLAINTVVDNRDVETQDGFWQNWYVYHEVPGEYLAREAQEKQRLTAQLEKAKAEKNQAVKKLKAIEPQIAVLEKTITTLENKKSQLIEAWNKQQQTLTDTVKLDLNGIAANYVDQKILVLK